MLPLKMLNRLRQGKSLAAQVFLTEAGRSGCYVMVIPQVPTAHEKPELYLYAGPRYFGSGYVPVLRDHSSISGYEIRYVEHDAKYTNTDWGYDYDMVLDDESTRVQRRFVSSEGEIEAALLPWITDHTRLTSPEAFDSSLVNSPIDTYLDRREERPHLWRTI
jgi:hypothetical protein